MTTPQMRKGAAPASATPTTPTPRVDMQRSRCPQVVRLIADLDRDIAEAAARGIDSPGARSLRLALVQAATLPPDEGDALLLDRLLAVMEWMWVCLDPLPARRAGGAP